jgi:hypothetical protein
MQGLSQFVCEPMQLHAQLGQRSCGGWPWLIFLFERSYHVWQYDYDLSVRPWVLKKTLQGGENEKIVLDG